MKSISIIICPILIFFLACKKDNNNEQLPIQVYLDIPFELTSKTNCYLLDTIIDSTTNNMVINKLQFELKSIQDFRAYGVGCMSSTGGYAEINTTIKFNANSTDSCIKPMPGCTNGGEWDTINTFAPKCNLFGYRLFLLKLNPIDSKPDKLENYSVKYLIKR